MADLFIVGAGGFARETAAAVWALNEVRPVWTLKGFLDDNPDLWGSERVGLPILGSLDLVHETEAAVVVCIGNPGAYGVREEVVRRLDLPADRYATIVHPAAALAADCLIGPGTVILAQTVLTSAVTVGAHVAIMPQAVLTHDNTVEEFATIASGVRLGGGVRVRRGAYIGAGALVRESVHIGEWSLVGMGSVVLDDVPAGQVWVGNPARYLRDQPTTQNQRSARP
jgi:sugar O-acyltransferase (sialic acid O-acetyltransferase NeuD family)